MSELFDSHPSIVSGDDTLSSADIVEFHNLWLKYDDKVALKDINLTAKRGKVYALVGDSGAGKSSFVNLLVRFYDATTGELMINSQDIKSYSLLSLHQKIAYVTQRVYIFQDSILANVAYGSDQDRGRAIEALKKAHAWEFVESLSDGIDTILDEFGVNLSGGQRQRIALARALYKSPDILILDEATSALDNKSEKAIEKALEEIRDSTISFIVAHRLTTIERADTILLFKAGEIVARGSYSELLESSDEFRKLANNKKA
jgi:subfamily B ATP-binding cassette protein MsbA